MGICCCDWCSAFCRRWFEIYIWSPFAGEESLPQESQPEKSKVENVCSHSAHVQLCLAAWSICDCKRNGRFRPILVCSDRGNSRLPGEPKLRAIRPGGRGQPWSAEAVRGKRLLLLSAASWCSLICDSFCSVLTMPSGSLFVHLSHVMRELLDTERIYVEELLSVLLVRGGK